MADHNAAVGGRKPSLEIAERGQRVQLKICPIDYTGRKGSS